MKKKTPPLKIVFINCAILIIGAVITELLFGGWLKQSNKIKYLNIVRDQKMEYATNLYSKTPVKIAYSKDKYGFRGGSIFNHPEKIDILTIGGSTTDQRYITDGATWQDIIEKNFKDSIKTIRIANAGVDGQSTYGHIKDFQIWFSEVPNLKPKYILFYIGINDFFQLSDPKKFEQVDDLEARSFRTTIKENSVFYNLLRILRGIISAEKVNVGHAAVDFSKAKYITQGITTQAAFNTFDQGLNVFEKRINKLIGYTKSMGAEPIFVTQPTLVFKWSDKNELEGQSETWNIYNEKYNGVDYYNFLNRLNERIKKVAGGTYLVIDLTSKPIWRASDFYDFYHNTPIGAQKVGYQIFKEIKNKF